eukprot:Skav215689  [mRNA]  locus=scaffold278:317813:320399:- [translate_table: standard]
MGGARSCPFGYSSTLRACVASQEWAMATDLFGTSLTSKQAPQASAFNAAITCGNPKVFRWQSAFHVVERMMDWWLRPSAISFNSILNVCEKLGKSLAWEIALDRRSWSPRCGAGASIHASALAFDAILSASSKTFSWRTANALLEDGLEFRAGASVWDSARNGTCRRRVLPPAAVHLLLASKHRPAAEHATASGAPWDPKDHPVGEATEVEATGTSYNALLGSQGGSWAMALVVLGEMRARRIPVDQVSWRAWDGWVDG